jgi:hypothetical protein
MKITYVCKFKLSSNVWLCRSSRPSHPCRVPSLDALSCITFRDRSVILFCIVAYDETKKSKSASGLVPLNRSVYRNGHAFLHSTFRISIRTFYKVLMLFIRCAICYINYTPRDFKPKALSCQIPDEREKILYVSMEMERFLHR